MTGVSQLCDNLIFHALRDYALHSFGVFQEKLVDVVLNIRTESGDQRMRVGVPPDAGDGAEVGYQDFARRTDGRYGPNC